MNTLRPISRILYPLALLSLLGLGAVPAVAKDNDAVMPPPSEVQDTPAARETAPAEEKAPNLGEELKGSGKDQQVEVYSYQRKDGAKIEEYSVQGKVYMVKVQPPGGLPPYYLYDRNGDGNFERLPGGYKRISPPMWVIKRF